MHKSELPPPYDAVSNPPPAALSNSALLCIARNAQVRIETEKRRIEQGDFDKKIDDAANLYFEQILQQIFSDKFEENLMEAARKGEERYPLVSLKINSDEGLLPSFAEKIIKRIDELFSVREDLVKIVKDRNIRWKDNYRWNLRSEECVYHYGSIDLVIDFNPKLAENPPNKSQANDKKKRCTIL